MSAGIGDPVLRDSYLDAARDLLGRNGHRLPQFALPIFFLQRHALELALKDATETVAVHHHVTSRASGPRPGRPWGHDLRSLLGKLNDVLRSDEAAAPVLGEIGTLVERFHDLDDDGTWARYRNDHVRAEMDLGKAQRELDGLFERLFAYPRDPDAAFGHITEYDCVTHDFEVREELGG